MKRAVVVLSIFVGSAATWGGGCSQQATTVPLRSLERSGRATVVCIGDPASTSPGRQLDACVTPPAAQPVNDYGIPHAIALVTQTARGEVAVVDVTAQLVLDASVEIPGYNFLPVGAIPTDVAATPGGNATFVSVGDPVRPGIFAIPSARLPIPVANHPPSPAPTLASWPACSLDSVPTEILVVPSPAGTGAARCDGSATTPAPTPGLDLTAEAEVFGRLKLVAVLPDVGQVVVMDAQELLMRPPGSFDRCPIERTVALQAMLPGAPASVAPDGGTPDAAGSTDAMESDAATADGGAPVADAAATTDAGADVNLAACSTRVTPSPLPSQISHPVSMALADDGRLFVSDDSASVIHVLDVSNPCAITEGAPLLPVSAADPTRAVVSSSIAVSTLTSDMKRFVYAVDARGGGTLMVFDVSADSTERTPLLRPDRQFNPFEPPDRMAFSAPVEAITFANHEAPLGTASASGAVARGVKCDPNVTMADTTNPVFPYLPVDFTTGAGPRVLRGTFGFAALTNGKVAVIDVEDFDQACRRPTASDDPALGCDGTLKTLADMPLPSASGEASCKIVERHRPRSINYFANATNAGLHAPSMQTFPTLFDKLGTVLPTDPIRPESMSQPKLLGPSLASKSLPTRALLASVGGSDAIPDAPGVTELSSDPNAIATRNWVAFDLREPRAHFDQTWSVRFEGVLPFFDGRRGRLVCAATKTAGQCEGGDMPSNFVLLDPGIGFCDVGAQDPTIAKTLGLPATGDIVQVTDTLPDPADPYWSTVTSVCSQASCEALYGTPDDPRSPRDLQVTAAYQDRLVLQSNADRGRLAPLDCCFPYPPTYALRAGQQWLVTGSVTGYQHHIIPDPTQANPSIARCIVSCDPLAQLRNGRAVARPVAEPVPEFDAAGVFRNAQIQFVLWAPKDMTAVVSRDSFFSIVEMGGFTSMEVPLAASTTLVLPQSIRYVRGIDQLAIPDAVSQGLMLFDLNVLSANGVKPLF